MPLTKVQFKPGFNKQVTESGGEGQWIDGDNVRFRYGQPEKIGGWQALSSLTMAGPARDQHTWNALDGKRYAAIGTSKLLVIYYEGNLYDITPIESDQTGCTFDSTTSSSTVTVNLTAHNLDVGDYVIFSSVSLPGGGETGYTTDDFETNPFEVLTTPDNNTFTITMPSAETGTGMSAQGSATLNKYVTVGPTVQTPAFGYGTGVWDASTFGWGEESGSADVTLDPGTWHLDNFGQILVATIINNKTFTWDPSTAGRLNTRATVMAGAPTKSILTLVSDRDRHLFHMGTETTIGDTSTQDKMFIRFSDQEDFNTYAPTATNTAGTFRLDTGNEIKAAVQGKDYIFVVTDQAAYVIQFVGPPFTFSVRQVGTNCGCLGYNSLVYAQGAVFWMGFGGGFFKFDGTVKQLDCLVEDFVFTTNGGAPGINYDADEITYASHNSLYNEVMWFYAANGETQVNRVVTYNYIENTWTTGTLARTTYADNHTYELPYATEYTTNGTPTFPTINGVTNTFGSSTYYAHEVGTDETDVNGNFVAAITSSIQSGDFDIDQRGFAGDGELIMRVSRFIPDFQNLQGNAKVTLLLKDYPSETEASSPLGPFTISTSTDKIDTRARGRLMSVKIENDSQGEAWRYGTLRLDIHAGGRR